MLIRKILLSLLALFVLASCTKDEQFALNTSESDVQRIGASALAKGKARGKSESVAIYENPAGEWMIIPGAHSELRRTKNGITAHFKTENLIPGNAYTLWFVVFGDEPGPPSSTYAAGHIVGASGKGNFSGHLHLGDGFDAPRTLTEFDSPLTAEVHLALRTHGPAQPGIIPSQINTMDGGCTSGFPSGPSLHPDSDEVGYCANIQVAVHPGN
ncbi:hypothetical protein GGR28_003213 [Lewinella aquimaris]|uniref:Uncharacterized protein n=1 Tax=Neolewinella aquimaris TaxID=1835722 RepID=A0A840EF69_9BACT|nr:hypothetical protein [Neolewinella aquimaris]MBB4080578.1 hypothetical protein [Neolewinella aquimaris]